MNALAATVPLGKITEDGCGELASTGISECLRERNDRLWRLEVTTITSKRLSSYERARTNPTWTG